MKQGLYVIITNPVLPYHQIAEICVSEKVPWLQLREKNKTDAELLLIAKTIQSITNGSDTSFIVNDRVDIALLANADGVHLGQNDLPYDSIKNLVPKSFMIGLSTHSIDQAKQALEKRPSYIGFGPIWPTPTKKIPDPAVGTHLLAEVLTFAELPVIAIGGIDESNLQHVLCTGAHSLSMVRFLMQTTNLKERIKWVKSVIN